MKPLDFYASHSAWTDPGHQAGLFEDLPDDVGELARIVQGLAIYDVVAEPFYGFRVPGGRADEIHLRGVERLLQRIVALDGQPLAVARPVEKRLASRCHHYSLLFISMLRAKGIPARRRGGFGTYFNAPRYEDHWVAEYWNGQQRRWVLADAQLDKVWLEKLGFKHDPLDLPRDQFVVAADAWRMCRNGEVDASLFGISFADLRGLWFVAGSLMRDVAALNKQEMLPWDVWGAQPASDASFGEDERAFFDRLAALASQPDAAFDELRELYEENESVRVPPLVFNAVLQRNEAVGEPVDA